MKEILLKQYIEVRRVVAVRVEDDCDEVDAAKMLDETELDNKKLPENMRLEDDWCYISDTGIEDKDGKIVLHTEEEDVERG